MRGSRMAATSDAGGVMVRPYTSFSWELARDSLVLVIVELIRSRGAEWTIRESAIG